MKLHRSEHRQADRVPHQRLIWIAVALSVTGVGAAWLELPGFGRNGIVAYSIGIEQLRSHLASPQMALCLLAFCGLLLATRSAWHGRLSVGPYLATAYVLAVTATFGFCAAGEEGGFSLAKSVYHYSYGTDAHDFEGPAEVLTDYNANFNELLPHSRTHPPGPVLFFTATNAAAEKVAELFPDNAGFSDRGVLTFALEGNLGGILIVLLAWLWLFPLFGYVRGLTDDPEPIHDSGAPSRSIRAGLFAVAFGASCLNILLFAPAFDVLHPLLAISAAWSLQRGLAREQFAWSLIAGLLLGILLLASFGNLMLLPLMGWLGFGFERRSLGLWAVFRGALGILCGALLVAAALYALGYDYVRGFELAMNHHARGVNAVRGYLPFLFRSPYIFFLWIGAPVLVGALIGMTPPWFKIRNEREKLGHGMSCLFVVLVFSGISRGETERLWLSLVPFLVALAASGWSTLFSAYWKACLLVGTGFFGVLAILLLTQSQR